MFLFFLKFLYIFRRFDLKKNQSKILFWGLLAKNHYFGAAINQKRVILGQFSVKNAILGGLWPKITILGRPQPKKTYFGRPPPKNTLFLGPTPKKTLIRGSRLRLSQNLRFNKYHRKRCFLD